MTAVLTAVATAFFSVPPMEVCHTAPLVEVQHSALQPVAVVRSVALREQRSRRTRSAKALTRGSRKSRSGVHSSRSKRRRGAQSRRQASPLRWEKLLDTLLADGVRYQRYWVTGAVGQRLHVLRVNLQEPSLELMLIPSAPGQQQGLSEIVRRYDSLNVTRTVIAAINGYFWNRRGLPVGITASDGELLQLHRYKRWSAVVGDGRGRLVLDTFLLSVWVRFSGKDRIPLAGVNARQMPDGIVLYTRAAGDTIPRLRSVRVSLFDEDNPDSLVVETVPADTLEQRLWKLQLRSLREPALNRSVPCQVIGVDSGAVPVPLRGCVLSLGEDIPLQERLRIGDTVWIESSVSPPVPFAVRHIWSGTPQLLRNGRLSITAEREGTVLWRFLHRRRPRTAIGWNRSREFLLVVVEQGEGSAGATIPELARLMQRLGAQWALNLDGGSSSGMYVRGGDPIGNARPVASALAVVQRRLWSTP